MDPILGAIPQTPQWVKDAFLELRRLRQRAGEPLEFGLSREPVKLTLRPDLFGEFKRFMEDMYGNERPSTAMQIGGVPVTEGPTDMVEPGWAVELQELTGSSRSQHAGATFP